MIFFYIDESGTSLNDPESPFFVLAAVEMPEDALAAVTEEVIRLKRQLVPYAKAEDFEIKGRDLRQGHALFKKMDWPQRMAAMQEVAEMIARLPVTLHAVRVDTRDLPEVYVTSNADLFRLAFWRLLEKIHSHLIERQTYGLLILDSQSTGKSSVQDRRLIDAYRDWADQQTGVIRFAERPLFGFSAFYAGLQVADFAAYMQAIVTGLEEKMSAATPAAQRRLEDLLRVFVTFQAKVQTEDIP